MSKSTVLLLTIGLCGFAGDGFAQTIQQPVFGVTSVGTTVSIPDRGTAHLGSISRAADSRRTYGFGPFRPGSNRGLDRSHTSISTTVTIHDFRAMDEALLNGTARGIALPAAAELGQPFRRHYDHREYALRSQTSYRSRLQNTVAVDNVREAGQTQTEQAQSPSDAGTMQANDRQEKAERFMKLGRAALKADNPSLAKLHFRAAFRNGAREATDELKNLSLRRSPTR